MLRWLEDLTETDAAVVGPKIARLQTLRGLGIEVPDEDAEKMTTVKDAVEYIDKHSKGK